jgi:hypothetical protein
MFSLSKKDFYKACIESLKKMPSARYKLIIIHSNTSTRQNEYYSMSEIVTAINHDIELKDNVNTFAFAINELKQIKLSTDEDIKYSDIIKMYIYIMILLI